MGEARACRVAGRQDAEEFMAMVEQFVREGGSPGMTWGEQTRDFYRGLFDLYVESPERGVVVIARGRGFSLAGGPIPYNTPWGKTAAGWGTWVSQLARGKGLARLMRRLVIRVLQANGYVAVIGGTAPDNGAAQRSVQSFGWQPLAETGVTMFDVAAKEDGWLP